MNGRMPASSRVATRLAAVAERARADRSFRRRLLAEPRAVLLAAGVPVPARRPVRVVQVPAGQAGVARVDDAAWLLWLPDPDAAAPVTARSGDRDAVGAAG